MNNDDEIRELLGPPSQILRIISAESFLNLAVFNQLWHPEAVKLVEYLKLLDVRLENVIWNVKPPYSVLLRLTAESQRRYFVASTGAALRLYEEQVHDDHLVMECRQSKWTHLSAAVVKKEFGA